MVTRYNYVICFADVSGCRKYYGYCMVDGEPMPILCTDVNMAKKFDYVPDQLEIVGLPGLFDLSKSTVAYWVGRIEVVPVTKTTIT